MTIANLSRGHVARFIVRPGFRELLILLPQYLSISLHHLGFKPINFCILGSLVHLVNKTTRFARRNNCPLWGDGKDDARREALI